MSSIPSESAPVKEKDVLTLKMMILVLILAIIVPIYSIIQQAFLLYWAAYFGWGMNSYGIVPGPFIIQILLTLLLAAGAKKVLKLSVQQMTIIFSTIMMGSLVSGFREWGHIGTFIGPLYSVSQAQYWSTRIPKFWTVSSRAVVLPMWSGGAEMPIGEWITPITFWSTVNIFFAVLFLGMAVVLRRRWVEIERVTFPYGIAASELVLTAGELSLGVKLQEGRDKKILYAGIAIGFLIYLPFLLNTMFTWFPDIYGWGKPPWLSWHAGTLELNLAIPGLQTALPGSITAMNLSPWLIAICYLVPIEVLFSTSVAWIGGLIILPVILVNLGYYPFPGPLDAVARYQQLAHTGILKLDGMVQMGMIALGIPIWGFIFAWRHYRETLVSAFKGTKGEPGEPSYRTGYLMITIGFVAVSILMAISTGNLISAIYTVTAGCFICIALSRLYGESGPVVSFSHAYKGSHYWPLFAGMTDKDINTDYFVTISMAHDINGRSIMAFTGSELMQGLTVFRLGWATKTKVKDMLIPMLVAASIGSVISFYFIPWMCYTFGASRFKDVGATVVSNSGIVLPSNASVTPRQPFLEQMVFGFILFGILMFLRIRFVWFPLNAYGFAIGLSNPGGYYGYAGSAFIAWILKYITLKVGGTRTYEKYGIPIASGIMLGYALTVFIAGVGSIYRFFYPY